jgi:hypothetical protein
MIAILMAPVVVEVKVKVSITVLEIDIPAVSFVSKKKLPY